MASSGNFMTWSSLWSCDSSYPPSPSVFSGGNCRYSSSNSNNGFGATHSFLSGKWYWEVYIVANGNKQLVLGLVTPETKDVASQLWNTVGVYGVASGGGVGYKLIENSPGFVEIDGFDDVANGDIVQLAFDRDNYKLWVGRNNTWLESGDPAGDSNPLISGSDFAFQGGAVMPIIGQGSGSTFTMVLNAGQDDTFGGEITAAGNADGNGFGVFKYAPPTGFLAPCSGNLPISDDIDPAQTDDNIPTKQFNVVTYTGNSSTNAVTGLNLQPDLLWVKKRSATGTNYLSNTSRGINKFLFSNGTDGEQTGGGYASIYSSFDSDGFTLGSSATGPNDSGATYVAWGWKAGGATTATNSAGAGATPTSGSVKIDGSNLGSALAGTIPANTISANTKGGFSIIDFTGTGSNGTVAHGLSNAPAFVIVKKYSTSGNNWCIFHQGLASANTSRIFFTTAGRDSGGGTSWNSTAPSSSVISLGTNGNVNTNGSDYLIYAWSEIEGYSKFSTYLGNGNADGPFIYTGFRPRMVFIKKASASNDWVVTDTARNTGNPASNVLRWDDAAAESSSNREIDLLSNGFKPRTTNDVYNGSGGTYIYGAWGDVPFRYNNTF